MTDKIEYGDVSQLPWTPFVRVYVDTAQFDTDEAWERYKALAAQDQHGRSAEDYRAIYQSLADDECYRNSRYLVFVRRHLTDNGEGGTTEMVHLSIKRHDQQVIHDWRDLQQVKNELVGPECEGVELFPAESRIVDTANQYHIWCVNDPNFRWPIGWHEGSNRLGQVGIGEQQRPFEIDVNDDIVDRLDYKAMWLAMRDRFASGSEQGEHAGSTFVALSGYMAEMEEASKVPQS